TTFSMRAVVPRRAGFSISTVVLKVPMSLVMISPRRSRGQKGLLRRKSDASFASSDRNEIDCSGVGMSSSGIKQSAVPVAKHVSCARDMLTVELSDGRSISVPLAWYPRLLHGTADERANWKLIGDG